ncbi:MAG: hypothetical protein IJV27_08115 [Prevotella sp.]|nr:hypothetical protein [Prevotella sp.]
MCVGFLLLASSALFFACKKTDQAEVAANTAKLYYEYLLQGKYNDYVSGLYQTDSIPQDYYDRLAENAEMFMEQQQKEHKGIREVRINDARFDEETNTAEVFLSLVFGDGNIEQVLVPMIESGGLWLMR